uniref:Glycosyltransferase 2-like domain-containing protein n=1 Tax=Salarias fasciatus TaxID=181472 RepID=A0A672I895_SALFA
RTAVEAIDSAAVFPCIPLLHRTSSVLSKLLYALPNSPLQYPIQGYTVRPLTPTLIPGTFYPFCILLHSAFFKFENHEAVFPIAIKQPQVPVLYDMGTGRKTLLMNIRSQVTILTKTFLRYPQLKVLLASIRQFYPNITVIIADDSFEPEHISGENIQQYIMPPAQGWFAGRNLAVSQVVTKYFLWVDDDFLFTQNTKIEEFVKVMEAVPELDVVRIWSQFYFSILYEEGDEVEGGCLIRKSGGKFHPLPGFPKCSLADGVVNFFLARTDAVRRVGFDPQLQRVAHSEFFMDGLGLLMVATCKDVKISHQRKTEENTNPRYTEFRRPKNSDNNFKSQLHYFKNHLKCIRYS